MGLKRATTITASYRLPTLNEPFRSKLEMLPSKYLQTELPLENKELFMGHELPFFTPEEKIANAKKREMSEERIRAIEHIVSNNQPKTIEVGKQKKHITGTILFPISEAQKLVNSLHGTGEPDLNKKGKFFK